VDSSFVSSGFDNWKWKKALEKGRGFRKRNESKSHLFAENAYRSFLQQKPVDAQLSAEKDRAIAKRQQLVQRNRHILARIFDVVVPFLARLSLSFRGHDESQSSHDRGVSEICALFGQPSTVTTFWLNTYLSPGSQNDMITPVGEAVQLGIVHRVKASGIFTVLMDETTDVAHQEQVTVFVRFVNAACNIEERLLAIVDTAATTDKQALLVN